MNSSGTNQSLEYAKLTFVKIYLGTILNVNTSTFYKSFSHVPHDCGGGNYTLVTHTIDLDPYEVPTGVIIILIIWILSQDNLSQDRAGMDRLVTGLTPIIHLFRKQSPNILKSHVTELFVLLETYIAYRQIFKGQIVKLINTL